MNTKTEVGLELTGAIHQRRLWSRCYSNCMPHVSDEPGGVPGQDIKDKSKGSKNQYIIPASTFRD